MEGSEVSCLMAFKTVSCRASGEFSMAVNRVRRVSGSHRRDLTAVSACDITNRRLAICMVRQKSIP